jgi:hypothetical protein
MPMTSGLRSDCYEVIVVGGGAGGYLEANIEVRLQPMKLYPDYYPEFQ